MTKKRLWLTVAISALIAPAMVHAQGEPEYGIKFGGFVKFDAFNDSRQVVAVRDEMFLLYPAARRQITGAPSIPAGFYGAGAPAAVTDVISGSTDGVLNKNLYIFSSSEDLNAHGQTGMTAIQSRISGKITAPDAFGAKVTGLLEFDFFGSPNDTNVQLGRMRHAWVNLDWGKTSFRAGQDWHPLFLQGGIFPGTLQFNPLAPIHPFGRAPQMAFTMKPVEGLRMTVYALEQGYHYDFDSTNAGNAKPLRSSKIPELAFQADYKVGGLTIGGTVDYKKLTPLPSTATQAGATDSQVGSNTNQVEFKIYQAYAQFKTGDLTLKASTTWGDNWSALIGLGGYAVKRSEMERPVNILTSLASDGSISAEELAAANTYLAFEKRQFSTTQSRGYWGEVAYGKEVEFAIVGGKVENLGASNEIDTSTLVGRGNNIRQVVTIAPRVKFTQGKTMIGLEYIYSAASYMEDDKNLQAIINDTKKNGALTGGADYATGAGYTTLSSAGGGTFENMFIRDSMGKINMTYTVVNHRIQFSVQQNF